MQISLTELGIIIHAIGNNINFGNRYQPEGWTPKVVEELEVLKGRLEIELEEIKARSDD